MEKVLPEVDRLLEGVLSNLRQDENFKYIVGLIIDEFRKGNQVEDITKTHLPEAIAYWLCDKLDDSKTKDIINNYLTSLEYDPPDGWDYREP